MRNRKISKKIVNEVKFQSKIYSLKEHKAGYFFSINFYKKIDEGEYDTAWLNCTYFGDLELEEREEYILEGYMGVKEAYGNYAPQLMFFVQNIKEAKSSNRRVRKDNSNNDYRDNHTDDLEDNIPF